MVTQYDLTGTTCVAQLAGSDPTKDADFDAISGDDDNNAGLRITYNYENKKDGCSGEAPFVIEIGCSSEWNI